LIAFCDTERRETPALASNVDVCPADQALLVLVVRAVDDQAIDESLEEDGGGASSSETST
jgi:hypothetical protein